MKIFNRLLTSLLAVCMLVGAQSFVVSADRMPAKPGKGEYGQTAQRLYPNAQWHRRD